MKRKYSCSVLNISVSRYDDDDDSQHLYGTIYLLKNIQRRERMIKVT